VPRFCDQNEGLVLPLKSWYDFVWRGAILLKDLEGLYGFKAIMARFLQPWRDFGHIQTCLFKLKSVPNIRVTNLGEHGAILTSRDG